MNYAINVVTLIGIYWIVIASYDVVIGHAGIFDASRAAFFGLGAYTSAILALRVDPSFPVLLLAAAGLCAVVAVVVAGLTLNLSGLHIVIGTLGIQYLAEDTFRNWKSLTNGSGGLFGIPAPHLGSWTIQPGTLSYTALVWLLGAAIVLALGWLVTSPFGRNLRAIREDAPAARSLGTSTLALQLPAFALSAAATGVAGSLYAHSITFIDPDSFSLNVLMVALTGVLVGGSGSLLGPLVGAVVVVAIPELLSFLPLTPGLVGPGVQALYGILLILVILWRPSGIVPESPRRYSTRLVPRALRRQVRGGDSGA